MGFLCTLLLLWGCVTQLLSDNKDFWKEEDKQKLGYCDWKCMKFVQSWPGSFCVFLGKRFNCMIPEFVNTWTIHGLWPNDVKDCCNCWNLFQSDLLDLESQLSLYWPSLINTTSFLFWKNEWHKHGSCAGCIETLSSPSKYFRAALKLHTFYSMDIAFQRAGIVPSCDRSYPFKDLSRTLLSAFTKTPELQCVMDEKGREVLVQVKISLHRNFSSGCEDFQEASNPSSSPYRPCNKNSNIYYFPINRRTPRDPCP
ncbi:ribonuclease T2 isoform X1 [Microcaecilia unicolor]|uniref:Ribonuclease T2-like isoform X1 n=1 Tax=Microcaecilia unicolor TaxID=1415580 RepID=A0A6P7ZGT1_9AMPH|nr:ribonuclease T2-like isoform X1 [Microcaecilia unicolor]